MITQIPDRVYILDQNTQQIRFRRPDDVLYKYVNSWEDLEDMEFVDWPPPPMWMEVLGYGFIISMALGGAWLIVHTSWLWRNVG